MKLALTTDIGRWQRIETILDQILDLPAEARSALLDEACAGDAELRAEVEALLAADADAGAFLGVPVGEYAPELLAEAAGEEGEEDLAGRQMGPYRLLREIGGGGMGTVYEAEDTRLRRRVAVKLLPPEYSRDRRAKERFLREAEATAKVDHPNLCTVHDVGESEGRLYIVLSFYEGETLRERIRRGPLPVAEAREIAIQVARGLARAHEAGIVHRDIKPANVILPRRGEAKILDFGIARLEGDDATLTRTGARWGTPAYMSPEQARGKRVDGRTDIWSLGVMLYEMLAGRRPFGGESMEAVISAILTQEPEPLERVRPEVPPELALVVERALARHPSERYASAAELLDDLESGEMPAGLRARRRSTRVVTLVAGALVILVLLGSILVWRPWHAAVGPPLRVAVLQPVVKSAGNDPDIAFVSSEIVEAALSTLVNLEGLQVLDPPDENEGKGSEAERLQEADEVLLPLLNCRGRSCQVIFRRRKSGGVLVATEVFEVPVDLENAYSRVQGVQVHLQQIYFDYRMKPGLPGRTVNSKDYSAYRDLERRSESGERLGDKELAQLDDLLRTSPGLVGAYLLAANITRVQGMLVRARTYSMQAQEIAPYDPEPLFTRFRIEMEGRQLDAAQAVLAELAKLAPGDARADRGKADLLEARGKLKDALRLRKEVAKRRPTWRNVRELATLEFRLGEFASGRQRIGTLLAEQPDNQSVRETEAFLEASFGDLERAAEVYDDLIRARPARSYLTNLAFVRFLLGDYAAAAAANRSALLLEPEHLLSRFNLATALEAQGKRAEARRLYRTLEKELAAASTSLDRHSRMLQAQCFIRLGRRDEAIRLADELLEQRPEDVQDLHQAAQLYALLGDPVSARYYVKLAREKDLRREWFMIPEFHSLQNDPEFQALLGLPSTLKAAG